MRKDHQGAAELFPKNIIMINDIIILYVFVCIFGH